MSFELSYIFTNIGFSSTLIVNSFLVYLTIFYVKNFKGTYKHLVIPFSIRGIVFASLKVVARPFIHNYNNSLIFFSLNTSAFSYSLLQFSILFWAGCYVLIVSSIATQFVFRYLYLFDAGNKKQFGGVKVIIWVGYPLLPGTIYTFLVYYLCAPDEYSDEYLRDVLLENYSLDISNLPRFTILPMSPEGNLRWKSSLFLISGIFIISFHYFIIIYCGLKINFNMKKELAKFSQLNQKFQKQIFKALVIQTIAPTVLIFIPAIPILLSPTIPPSLGIQINWQTGWLYAFVGLYPPFDSITFILVVSEYKKIIKQNFLCLFVNRISSTSADQQSFTLQPRIN